MASKRRIRRQQCGTKKRYDDMRAAEGAARTLMRLAMNRGGQLRGYRCGFCGKFHIGHTGAPR